MSEEKNAPISRVKKNKYSSYVFLSFILPDEKAIQNGYPSNQKFVKKRLKKHPNAQLIHISKHDFEIKDGRVSLKSDRLQKYQALRAIDNRAKISIFGHGNKHYPRNIFSDPDVNFRETVFSVEQVTSILQLISDKTVRVSKSSLTNEKIDPSKLLKISVLACQGEVFANTLMQELASNPASLYACSITACKKDRLMKTENLGRKQKRYRHESVFKGEARNILAMIAGIGCIVGGKSINYYPAQIILIIVGALLLVGSVANLLIVNQIRSVRGNNAKDKVVIAPHISNEGKLEIKTQNKNSFYAVKSKPAAELISSANLNSGYQALS